MNSYTEDEARLKFCPFYQKTGIPNIRGEIIEVDNRYEELPPYNCLGSKCMAWQWEKATLRQVVNQDSKGGEVSLADEPDAKSRGYCGLLRRE